jgi:hypothetical protein
MNSNSLAQHKSQNKRNNTLTLWIILLLPLSMIMGSTLYFNAHSEQFLQPENRVNYGDLLIEKEVQFDFVQQKQAAEFSEKWLLLWPQDKWSENRCIECEANLEKLSNVVKALGKYQSHMRPVLLSPSPLGLSQSARDFPNIQNTAHFAMLSQNFSQYEYFLVDDQGWLVLGYPKDAEFKLMLKDMKRLMKRRY